MAKNNKAKIRNKHSKKEKTIENINKQKSSGKILKKKNNKRTIRIKRTLILGIILSIIVFVLISKNNKNIEKEKNSLILDNQDITAELQNEIIEKQGIIYMSFEDIQKYIDKTIYKEPQTNLIITSSSKKLATLNLDESTIKINGSNVEIDGQAFDSGSGKIYIPISELENVYDIELTYIEESKNITIDYYSKSLVKAYTTKKVSVKEDKGIFSKTLLKIKKDNWVVVISEGDGWSKIRTQDGFIGYVKSKHLTNYVTEREEMGEESAVSVDNEEKHVDITNKNIQNFNKREKVINQILLDAIENECKEVEITYKEDLNDEENENFERFKIEVQPILKECGIKVVFK